MTFFEVTITKIIKDDYDIEHKLFFINVPTLEEITNELKSGEDFFNYLGFETLHLVALLQLNSDLLPFSKYAGFGRPIGKQYYFSFGGKEIISNKGAE